MARFRSGFGRRFILTVETEGEYDRSGPIRRDGHGLAHLPRLAKFQQFCENEDVCPVYLVDYPVATSALAADILREPVAKGRAEIGIQIHQEDDSPHQGEGEQERKPFATAVPGEVERAKLNRLRMEIERNFDALPQIYRAGRSGPGPHVGDMLRDSGIAMDSSVRPKFDLRGEGGADFSHHPLGPYWLDAERSLLELPLTTVYWGMLRKQGNLLYPRVRHSPRLQSFLARLGLLSRIPLTPACIDVEEAIQGIDIALDDGLPLLVFSFHGSSLRRGGPRSEGEEDDPDRLYDWWGRVFAYLAARGVPPTNVREIMSFVEV